MPSTSHDDRSCHSCLPILHILLRPNPAAPATYQQGKHALPRSNFSLRQVKLYRYKCISSQSQHRMGRAVLSWIGFGMVDDGLVARNACCDR
jgi:hypothetical protein